MEDMAPGLLKQIQVEYRRRIQESEVLAEYEQAIKAGRADYEGAAEAARELGEILAAVYQSQLSSEVLPDGKMYYNIALRILDPTLKENYENAADYAEAAQKILNENAGLGLKAIRPAVNQDAINGLVNRISSEEHFNAIKWILDAPVKTFTQKVVDESVRKNAEFHYKAGLKPKIVRKSSGKCCAWCSRMAGVYSYPDVPKDVYRRHDNCNCTVEYDPGSGKRQNVWSKQWKYEADSDTIKKRKLQNITPDSDEIIQNIRENVIPAQNRSQIAPRQEIHRKGTTMYESRKRALEEKGEYGPSYITVSDEKILQLVKQYSGTGMIKYNRQGNWDSKEIITTNDEIIGVVIDNRNGNSAETPVFKIHYAKDGIHIVPDYPSKKR